VPPEDVVGFAVVVVVFETVVVDFVASVRVVSSTEAVVFLAVVSERELTVVVVVVFVVEVVVVVLVVGVGFSSPTSFPQMIPHPTVDI
jgi:hypothetical protein